MSRTLITTFVLSLALTLSGGVLSAAQPQITLTDPPGMQRGTEIDLVVRGARLADAQEMMFLSPGLSVKQLKAKDAGAVEVRLAAAADCSLGIHAFRLRTTTGISNLWTFAVGSLPETAETEPNGDFAQPQSIPPGTTVTGVVTREDVDYFVVEAKKGERITAELEGMRLGITFFDPYVAILNQQRFDLAKSDDEALLHQDPVCSIVAPADGKYVVEVRDSAFEGSDRCRYRLHVGRFPRPHGVLPAGGRPGETLQASWVGGPGDPRSQQVTLPPVDQIPRLATARAPLTATDDHGSAPSPNYVRVSDLANVVEVEPNNQNAEATSFTAPAALNGAIQQAGDVDIFRFAGKKGQRYDIRLYARQILRSPLDGLLRVRDATGKQLAASDDSGGPDSYLRFAVPADGDYQIELYDHRRRGGPSFVYRVEVAPVQPRLVMYLPERERYVSTALAVPRGNRMALMVGARRSDFGGLVQMQFNGLPAGVSAQAIPVPADRSEAPVLFTAAEDAQLSGALVDIVGRVAEGNPEVEGHLDQRTMLVRGQNNRDVWGHDSDRMAAVVTQEVPVKIDIVQPRAPLVRNGSMQLKVVATRQEGFTDPIAVRMLYNPPGVASAGVVSIPKDKNEVVIPLTANGSATIGKWPIVVTAQAPGAHGGRIDVASQIAELEVADHFFELAFGKSAVEQGKQTALPVKISHKRPFEGKAQVQVVGLPPGASCEPLEFDKQSAELALPITTAQDARVGRHRTILCRVVVTENGEPVTHTLGTGELRIDRPAAPKPAAVAKPKPEPQKTQPKVLTRLEQLRQQREAERASN
jgi:hypothetical protein